MDFSALIDYLLKPYEQYTTLQIVLEIVAASIGIVSVLFSIRKSIWVYPIGIVSTGLYSYLNYDWKLYGELLINVYYTIMSLYGWGLWFIGKEDFSYAIKISNSIGILTWIGLFTLGFSAVLSIYFYIYGTFTAIPTINYIDSLTASLFIVAMYLMAHKRIENWIFWIIGNTLAIYLFIYKGYAITAFQFFVFLILAGRGWFEWRKNKLS
ncbi:MAG: nicotinamide riboside transporter PnuC [Chitinophagales bacterium]|jgi:nicotinamide mononucleotide transporter|nr:nicotinamide riboside transporter PnuC [Sphingobacteriales bacterium]